MKTTFELIQALTDEGVSVGFARDFGEQTGTVFLNSEEPMFGEGTAEVQDADGHAANVVEVDNTGTHFHYDGEEDLRWQLDTYLDKAVDYNKARGGR